MSTMNLDVTTGYARSVLSCKEHARRRDAVARLFDNRDFVAVVVFCAIGLTASLLMPFVALP